MPPTRPPALSPLALIWAIFAPLGLAGCGPEGNFALAAVSVGTLPVLGRTVPDFAVSAVTGKDCSLVRVEQGQSYCRGAEPRPAPQPFCTRSLGVVDCWESAHDQPQPRRRGVADGPQSLTPEQEAYRTRSWPGLFRTQADTPWADTPRPGPARPDVITRDAGARAENVPPPEP